MGFNSAFKVLLQHGESLKTRNTRTYLNTIATGKYIKAYETDSVL